MRQSGKKQEVLDRFLKDPFTAETRKYRRNVLLVAVICILFEIFNVTLNGIPYVAIDSIHEPFLIKGTLSIMVLYHFLVFLCYCWVDFRAWYHCPRILVLDQYIDHIRHIYGLQKSISFNTERGPQEPEVLEAFIANRLDKLTDEIMSITKNMRALTREHKNVTRSQWFRIIAFDVLVPIFMGLLAVLLSGEYVIDMIIKTAAAIAGRLGM